MADEKTNASGKDIAVVSQDNSGQGRGVPDGNSPVERVTLDEMLDKARFIDENAEEPPEVERQICAMAERIISISKQGKPIRIVTRCYSCLLQILHKLLCALQKKGAGALYIVVVLRKCKSCVIKHGDCPYLVLLGFLRFFH